MWVVTSSYERYEGFAGEHLAEKNSDAFDWAHIKLLRDKEVSPLSRLVRDPEPQGRTDARPLTDRTGRSNGSLTQGEMGQGRYVPLSSRSHTASMPTEPLSGLVFHCQSGVERIQAHGKLISPTVVEVTPSDDQGNPNGEPAYQIEAPYVALTTGGAPIWPSEDTIPGANLGITSDGFFALEKRPKKVVVVGAGCESFPCFDVANDPY